MVYPTARQRRRKAELYDLACGALEKEEGTPLPSLHDLLHFDDLPLTPIITHDRVSGRDQRDHLRDRKKNLQTIFAERGNQILAHYTEVGSGKTLDRPTLLEAIAKARELNVPLVTTAFSRLLRSQDYDAHRNPEARPNKRELKRLQKLIRGVEVYVLNDPDATPPEDEAFLRELGKKKRKKPGHRRRRKERWLPYAKELREAGYSYREIAREVTSESGVPVGKSTVCRWLAP